MTAAYLISINAFLFIIGAYFLLNSGVILLHSLWKAKTGVELFACFVVLFAELFIFGASTYFFIDNTKRLLDLFNEGIILHPL